jgi:hypothetical protein
MRKGIFSFWKEPKKNNDSLEDYVESCIITVSDVGIFWDIIGQKTVSDVIFWGIIGQETFSDVGIFCIIGLNCAQSKR